MIIQRKIAFQTPCSGLTLTTMRNVAKKLSFTHHSLPSDYMNLPAVTSVYCSVVKGGARSFNGEVLNWMGWTVISKVESAEVERCEGTER